MWYADDAALVAHSAQDLKTLLSQFSSACSGLDHTISLKNISPKLRTNIQPTITLDDK